jgi:replicative DNA helicase
MTTAVSEKRLVPAAIRTLPEDRGAEAAVLGAMMIDPRCVGDAVEILDRTAFFHTENQRLWDAIVALWSDNGETGVNGLLVRQKLEQSGTLEEAGGIGYLRQVLETLPSSAAMKYYANIVKDKALLRELITASTDILNDAYDETGEPREKIEEAEQKIFAIVERGVVGEVVPAADLARTVYSKIENRKAGELSGLCSGYTALDVMTTGFQPGDMVILAARPSMGKAQPLDALIMTPDGFQPMGFVRAGDMVIGGDGKPCRVLGVFPQGMKQVFRVTFVDGTSTECCGDHLWLTQTRNEKRFGGVWSVKTCDEIARTLARPDGNGMNHRIPWVAPVEFAGSTDTLLLDPYLLGLWLGDGCGGKHSAIISNPEPDIQAAIVQRVPTTDAVRIGDDGLTNRVRRNRRTQQPSGMILALRGLGLDTKHSYDKFIPRQYLHARVHDRQQLLRGLLDTDGSVHSCGAGVEYTTASPQLAADVVYLARSLGAKVTMRQKTPTYTYRGERRTGRIAYRLRIYFKNGFVPVSSQKHLARWPRRIRGGDKMICGVVAVGPKPCQCVKVDREDGLYVTNDFIVTHNTALAMNMVEYMSVDCRLPGAVFSLEMSRELLMERLIVSRAMVGGQRVRQGTAGQEDFVKLVAALDDMCGVNNIYIDDTAGLTPTLLRAKARRLKARHGIQYVVVDYLQLMTMGTGWRDGRQQEVSAISRQVKAMARELGVPVLALSQLNRGPEDREDKRPRLSDLRESGALEQDADTVLFLHREDYYHRNDLNWSKDRTGELIVAKQRNGPTGTVKLTWLEDAVRFVNQASVASAP